MMKTFTPSNNALYLCDNGACYCGEHLGCSAKMTGRDLSGQPIMKMIVEDIKEAVQAGWVPACETCGKTVNLIHLAVR